MAARLGPLPVRIGSVTPLAARLGPFPVHIGSAMGPLPVRVLDFDGSDAHCAAFRDINLAWIREFFRVEPHDEAVLSDPRALAGAGAHIFVAVDAEDGATILGVCALLSPSACGARGYELAKMGVVAAARGRGVGRALGAAAVARADAEGAPLVDILSNRGLAAALSLYASLGFVEAEMPATDYERANIYLARRGPPGGCA